MIKCLALNQLKMIPKNVKNHSNCASGITSFDLALEQVKCVFPEANYSQFAMDFEVVDGKIVRP